MTLPATLLVRRFLIFLLASAFAASGVARAQTAQPTFKPEEIEALVAPIALYPDDLLSQVLMASTYPLEVVQAARWVKANPKTTGDAAVKAVADQSWDVSVKSLVAFPQVLTPMDEKLDWTQKLGDAFLADQKAVLDAVQRLRVKAQQAGNLKSNEQQKVAVEQAGSQQVIVIQPANPQVIYVPAYNPTVVYGGWGYAAYQPYYWPPPPYYYPGGALAAGFAWGVGIAAAGAIYGNVNWGGGDVNINVNRATNIDRNYNRNSVNTGGKWQHSPEHRQGVAYRDNASREKYGNKVGGADARGDYRGRDGGYGGAAGDRAGAADRAGTGNRAGDRPGGGDYGGNRPATADRGSYGGGDRGGYSGGAGRDNAFQGVGNNSATQRGYNRGSASNASMNANRGSAGAASRPAGQPRASGGAPRGGGGGGGRRR
ncbi:MAG: DUF3300 domain-containing protein [Betaproteobacteria bacterium]